MNCYALNNFCKRWQGKSIILADITLMALVMHACDIRVTELFCISLYNKKIAELNCLYTTARTNIEGTTACMTMNTTAREAMVMNMNCNIL